MILIYLLELHSAVLAHFMLKERLQKLGVLGCVSCIVGSVVIVIHAPQEHTPSSVEEIWKLATQPGMVKILLSFFSNLHIHHCKISFSKTVL